MYPGWYSGRTVHVHVGIRTYDGATQIGELVPQIFFDDTLTDTVFKQSPYSSRGTRDTRNANDMVLTGTHNGAVVYAETARTAAGYSAEATIGVSLKTAAAAAPAIAQAGVVNGASFKDGIAIFGQNLASGTRALTSSDLLEGNMPTNLGGVTVNINNKAAFFYYVSPARINVLAPADAAAGGVSVTVTNSAGTSPAASATLLASAPALFASGGNVAAVRVDGTVIDGAGSAAKPGETLAQFGTSFGASVPAAAPGAVLQGSARLVNIATVTIGACPPP